MLALRMRKHGDTEQAQRSLMMRATKDVGALIGEVAMSRSSAKRVLTRVETFDQVLLDFAAVRSIGQAFADEIFRVFTNAHPKVQLIAINANAQITQMIRRAQSARGEQTGGS